MPTRAGAAGRSVSRLFGGDDNHCLVVVGVGRVSAAGRLAFLSRYESEFDLISPRDFAYSLSGSRGQQVVGVELGDVEHLGWCGWLAYEDGIHGIV